MTTTKPSQTEALEADLERTRRHLAETVQELSRQLNVPRRVKESATGAGHRAVHAAGTAGARAKQMPATAVARAKQMPSTAVERAKHMPSTAVTRAKHMPATAREHPKAAAAMGGVMALGMGAAAWRMRHSK